MKLNIYIAILLVNSIGLTSSANAQVLKSPEAIQEALNPEPTQAEAAAVDRFRQAEERRLRYQEQQRVQQLEAQERESKERLMRRANQKVANSNSALPTVNSNVPTQQPDLKQVQALNAKYMTQMRSRLASFQAEIKSASTDEQRNNLRMKFAEDQENMKMDLQDDMRALQGLPPIDRAPLEAARVKQKQQMKQMQSYQVMAQEHAARVQERFKAFQEQIKSATSNEERMALREAFQLEQQLFQQEFQTRILELQQQAQ